MLSLSPITVKPFTSASAVADQEFVHWVDLLERRTGVIVPTGRKASLVTGLRMRMFEAGYDDFQIYYDQVLSGSRGAMEWATLVDWLTVHETRFFRHPPSYDLIAQEWLPNLLRSGFKSEIHAWSVGCATGEEAYSLAMTIDNGLRTVGDQQVDFAITATDISNPALAAGRAALYSKQRQSEIPEPFCSHYTEAVDEHTFAVIESLRKRVSFTVFNLLEMARTPIKLQDLIYCQNVLVYFARERRKRILEAFASRLNPGGLLVLGPGELIEVTNPSLIRAGGSQTLAYQRVE